MSTRRPLYMMGILGSSPQSLIPERERERETMRGLWVCGLLGLVLMRRVDGYGEWNVTHEMAYAESDKAGSIPLFVDLTLIQSAAAKGAVCLDGSLPGYHLHRGFGSGTHSWLIHLEGGAWCNDISSCIERSKTKLGSSSYMEKQIDFIEILSSKPEENPDFFNWNRVLIRYCDGASFSGEGYNEDTGLFFRGQRIWLAAMEELMSKGMHCANEAILTGCSAGGLATIIHCDEFRKLFPRNIKVKCLADAALFLDTLDVAGNHTMRFLYEGIVSLQGVAKNLPAKCTVRMDATSCFFPQNLVAHVQTPLFLLNAAYDYWQLCESLATEQADPIGNWLQCKLNNARCDPQQIVFLQEFRNQMLEALAVFSNHSKNGLFINSCFSHCQSIGGKDTWFSDDSPILYNKKIAESFGDWYFDRSEVKLVDCPYPCDKTCHHIVYSRSIQSFIQ